MNELNEPIKGHLETSMLIDHAEVNQVQGGIFNSEESGIPMDTTPLKHNTIRLQVVLKVNESENNGANSVVDYRHLIGAPSLTYNFQRSDSVLSETRVPKKNKKNKKKELTNEAAPNMLMVEQMDEESSGGIRGLDDTFLTQLATKYQEKSDMNDTDHDADHHSHHHLKKNSGTKGVGDDISATDDREDMSDHGNENSGEDDEQNKDLPDKEDETDQDDDGTLRKRGHRRKKRRHREDEFYDVHDPFIDDAEQAYEFPAVKPVIEGFFVYKGEIEVVPLYPDEENDGHTSDDHAAEKGDSMDGNHERKRKGRRKMFHSEEDRLAHRVKKRISNQEEYANIKLELEERKQQLPQLYEHLKSLIQLLVPEDQKDNPLLLPTEAQLIDQNIQPTINNFPNFSAVNDNDAQLDQQTALSHDAASGVEGDPLNAPSFVAPEEPAKFKWTRTLKQAVYSLVENELRIAHLDFRKRKMGRQRTQKVVDGRLRRGLYTELVKLWPEGWTRPLEIGRVWSTMRVVEAKKEKKRKERKEAGEEVDEEKEKANQDGLEHADLKKPKKSKKAKSASTNSDGTAEKEDVAREKKKEKKEKKAKDILAVATEGDQTALLKEKKKRKRKEMSEHHQEKASTFETEKLSKDEMDKLTLQDVLVEPDNQLEQQMSQKIRELESKEKKRAELGHPRISSLIIINDDDGSSQLDDIIYLADRCLYSRYDSIFSQGESKQRLLPRVESREEMQERLGHEVERLIEKRLGGMKIDKSHFIDTDAISNTKKSRKNNNARPLKTTSGVTTNTNRDTRPVESLESTATPKTLESTSSDVIMIDSPNPDRSSQGDIFDTL